MKDKNLKMSQKMATRSPQKILKGDRISIPREFLSRLNLKPGDYVLVESTSKGLQITPGEFVTRQ